MTFTSFDAALIWARSHAHESCRPSDCWEVVQQGRVFKIAIKFKWSGELIGYAD